MTGFALRRRLKTEYRNQEGVRFFSEKALLFALLEKRGVPRDYLIRRGGEELPEDFCAPFLADARRLLAGEPLQYYLGSAPFCGYDFFVEPGVLIPRPDTEVLVREAEKIPPRNGLVFDFCCGSGCVGLALALRRPDLRVALFDLSPEALSLSRKNRDRFGLSGRVRVEELDVLSPAAEEALFAERPALVVANPPYLDDGEMARLPDNVKREPPAALSGGADGLLFYRAFAALCRKTGIPFLAEIGYSQKNAVEKILKEAELAGDFFRDEGGRDRAVFFRQE